jgi:hypothetical protein
LLQNIPGLKQFFFISLWCLTFCLPGRAQVADSVTQKKDTTGIIQAPRAISPLQKLLNDNKYLNSQSEPVSLVIKKRTKLSEDTVFYILAGLLFFFGIIKTIYSRYFSTLFRVFFNSSLRQNQLTDQLMQAKLPSLFFNLVFLVSASFYVYLLLQKIFFNSKEFSWMLLLACFAGFAIVYAGKYLVLKFFGWITGFNSEADTYIFIVFLINKIIGICLLPVIIVIGFSDPLVVKTVTGLSLIFTAIMLLFRFIRSYGLLQHKLKISRFHFILYIFSLELLPLAIIYKATELFIMKKG